LEREKEPNYIEGNLAAAGRSFGVVASRFNDFIVDKLLDGALILKDLGLSRIRFMTNNLTKVVGLQGFGLEITERIPLEVEPNGENKRYLQTKKEKLNHVFETF